MIYIPAEDSYLLAEQIKKFAKNRSVLDVGTGSGILAKTAKSEGAKSISASDIDEEALRVLKKRDQSIKTIKSDLFEKINGKFDLIVFNPPYLPEDKREDKESAQITTGGKEGDEITIRFLKQALKHLNKNGIILLLVSSLTPMKRIDELIKRSYLKHETIARKKLFFEELFVYKIQKA